MGSEIQKILERIRGPEKKHNYAIAAAENSFLSSVAAFAGAPYFLIVDITDMSHEWYRNPYQLATGIKEITLIDELRLKGVIGCIARAYDPLAQQKLAEAGIERVIFLGTVQDAYEKSRVIPLKRK